MKKIIKFRSISVLMAVIIIVSTIYYPDKTAEAISLSSILDGKYITANDFVKELVKTAKLDVSSDQDAAYMEAAKVAGILKEADFTDYSKNITRTDAAVLLNRADEYLHGDKVDDQLLDFMLKKRISDIKKVPESKREAVAKVFAKGIIKGYFNGYYIQNRSFKGSDYITKVDAKSYIKLVTNTSKRAKLSPDGELIRTINLPKNAKRFEYILACYPNKFYERKFDFYSWDGYTERTRDKKEEIYPVEMRKSKFRTWNEEWAFSREMDKYLYDWAKKAETYLNYLFNVDYRTVDSKWVKGLAACYVNSNLNYVDVINEYYIKNMKKNNVIVESKIISVEPSMIYRNDYYCMRAYIKYRIKAKNVNVDQGNLIYTAGYPHLKNLKSGAWREGIFDIRFGTNNGYQGDGSDWAITDTSQFIDR